MKGSGVRVKRIILGLILLAVLVLLVAAPAYATPAFTDIGSSPYQASINHLASLGMIGGYDDNTFRPSNPLQRQQFAKMAVLTMGFTVTTADVSTFSDTPAAAANDPLYPGSYVAVASKNHIIEGYPSDNTFRFYNNLTREQAITIAVRAAGSVLADPPADYKGKLDYSDPTHGANIKKAEFNGLLNGIVNLASWDPGKNATRGEAAELLNQIYSRLHPGTILSVTGPSGTREFSMADLQALPATEGYGGWKNKAGVITAPMPWKGVSVRTLMNLVGGGTSVTVTASDGYEETLSADELNGGVTTYNPATGQEIDKISGTLSVIVAYQQDGAAISPADGPLRIAFVSPGQDQVTDGNGWEKWVVGIKVK
jgi:DMSO/TMAO reductase YedYZ molybdopterin-dependent catalytic subunit